MHTYDKEYWKQALYDAAEYDELDEEDEEEIGPVAYEMLEAAIEVLIETGYQASREELLAVLSQNADKGTATTLSPA